MKRLLMTLAVLAMVASFWPSKTKVWTVHAQTLPAVKTLAWDANPVGDAVINYVVQVDAVTVGSPTGLTQLVTFTTAGTHVLRVAGVNMWGQSAWATLTVNVVVPGAPAGMRIQ